MAKWLITLGIILVVMGLLWPLLSKIGLGHLPGDIRIERKGFSFYFPLTSSLLVSALLTLILWLFRR
jgi:prepilin signal peptidase PulO-like enzyme (type II secretory pathway)